MSQHPWADVRDRQGKLSTARVVPRAPPFKQPLTPLRTKHLPLQNSELSLALYKACSPMLRRSGTSQHLIQKTWCPELFGWNRGGFGGGFFTSKGKRRAVGTTRWKGQPSRYMSLIYYQRFGKPVSHYKKFYVLFAA